MAWSSEIAEAGLDTGAPGGTVDSAWVTLLPNELVHISVLRTDAGAVDRWQIDVLSSTDKVRTDNPPFNRYVIENANKTKSFIITGVYSYKLRISNAVGTPTDQVIASVFYRKNGVSV